MEANTGSQGGLATVLLARDEAYINLEAARAEGNVPLESAASSQGEADVAQQATPVSGSTFATLNPLAPAFTPRRQAANTAAPTSSAASSTSTVGPANQRRSTPPSLERFARDLQELRSSNLGTRERLDRVRDQMGQLLSHMKSAKAEMDELEARLAGEESVQGSEDILIRLRELKGLHEWAGYKWEGLREEVADLEAEIAIPGSREDEF